MQSQEGLTIQRNTRDVTTAADTHAAEIGRGSAAQLSPHLLPGETLPDIELAVRLISRALKASCGTALGVDAAHEDELGDDQRPRLRRDTIRKPFEDRLVSLRPTVIGAYGADAAKDIGFAGALPDDPLALAEYGLSIARRLPTLARYTPLDENVTINLERISAGLTKQAEELKTALQDVKTEEREAEASRLRKQAEFDRHAIVFRGGASAIEGLADLAGLFELSRRVRPSPVKRGRTEQDASGPTVDAPVPVTG